MGGVVVLVPATDRQGAILGADDARPEEAPAHRATIDAFGMDKFEVTVNRWQACVNRGACDQPEEWDAQQVHTERPVVQVSWAAASAFCLDAGGSLPTEAQWEYAARGQDGRRYPWGDEEPDCGRMQFDACGGEPRVVGDRPAGASPHGVEDLAGNVWEWTSDWFMADAYVGREGRIVANPIGPVDGTDRVVRGGAFDTPGVSGRTARRGGLNPTAGYDNVGFRCVYPPMDPP